MDNVNHVFSILKERFSGKYIELDFSENFALRPKHEVQLDHFSGKQHSLHCAIFWPSNTNFHYHQSDDTKHDAFYVNEVLRDLIQRYDIKNEDVVIQSDNAPTQYKNRHAFALLHKLADEFNLRNIRTYGAAGNGKGTIDGMSSFRVENVLRRDIVTRNIFFDKSEKIVDYLNIKNLQFYYAHIDTDMLAGNRLPYTGDCTPIEIKVCMKQHLIVFKPNSKEIVCREYLCNCSHCIDWDFNNCSSSELSDDAGDNAEEEF